MASTDISTITVPINGVPTTLTIKGSGGGGGSGGVIAMDLTQAQYDALTDAEKNNGTIYFINTIYRIGIKALPTKDEFNDTVGYAVDLSGLRIDKYSENGVDNVDVTADCVVDPPDGTVLSPPISDSTRAQNFDVTYTEGSDTYHTSFTLLVRSSDVARSYISVTSLPTKTIYNETNGYDFDSTGLAVAFVNAQGVSTDVTSSVTLDVDDGDLLSIDDGLSSISYPINVSYTTNGVTYVTSFDVTVQASE